MPSRSRIAVLALAASGLAGARSVWPAEPAELLLTGGVVHTLDPRRPRAEAVAVRGGRVVAVGTSAELSAYAGPKTRVLGLAGHTVFPGFEDAHAHFLGIGFARLDVDLAGTRTFAEVLDRVAKAVKGRPAGEWVRGRGWHEEKWTSPAPGAVRGFPTHDALSAISPDNPVVLERAGGHAVPVNAKAMGPFAIGASPAPPPGGELIRDASGNPTGVFVDNAQRLVTPPERTESELRRAVELATEECLAKGVTSLHDAGQPTDAIALYERLAAAGQLRMRLYVMASALPTMKALQRPRTGLGDGMLDVRAVKVYADGALGSRGAALLEAYADDPGNLGLLRTSQEEMLETARYALAHGFQVATHAIGDRANRLVLDVYQKALAERRDVADARFRIEHAQPLSTLD